MQKKKLNVLIVYEDNSTALEKVAKDVKKASASAGTTVKLRAASELSIPDVLAAEAFFFGVDSPASESWAELKRIMAGICLAGRACHFFTTASPEAVRPLRESLSASELADAGTVARGLGAAELSAWVSAALA